MKAKATSPPHKLGATLLNDLKDKLTDATTSLSEGAGGIAVDLQTRAEDAWDSVQHRTNHAVRESSAYVRKNSVPIALAAFGFGLVLGLLWNRREPLSFKDRYVSKPLQQSRGVLLGLLVACGTLLRRTFSSASSAAEVFAGNVGDDLQNSLKPLKRTARQTGRKFGF
jgi:ElaB/YqjD/DUF883 family membrane-anchored ribosome-binding protein